MRCYLTLGILAPLLAVAPAAKACSCDSFPIPFCMTDLDALAAKGNTLVFVGKITHAAPTGSISEMMAQWGSRSRSQDLSNLTKLERFERRRADVLDVYGDLLPEHERAKLLAVDDIVGLAYELAWVEHLQRMRVDVHESFMGDIGSEIELATAFNTSCSSQYRIGQTYLFEVRQGSRGKWIPIAACPGRTSEAEYAAENIRSLRAWKAGLRLAPRIYGRLFGMNVPVSNIRVSLSGDIVREVLSDQTGAFAFDDLSAGHYALAVDSGDLDLPPNSRRSEPIAIDLTSSACAEISPFVGAKRSR